MRSSEPSKLNILVSYAYMDKNVENVLVANKDRIRFLLDSGAFTAWKLGKPISLDNYCRYLESTPIKPWRYFTLDVIGNAELTLKNYETMLKRGFNPIPVFTRGECTSMIDEYYKTSDVVGIGGLVGSMDNKAFVNGIMKHVNNRNVHWLGFTPVDFIKHYKPYSCDSTTWQVGVIYARLDLYDDRLKRLVTIDKKLFLSKPKPRILELLRQHGIEPKSLAVKSNWIHTGRGCSPSELIGPRSWVKYSVDVEKT